MGTLALRLNESLRMSPQYYILSSTAIHCTVTPIKIGIQKHQILDKELKFLKFNNMHRGDLLGVPHPTGNIKSSREDSRHLLVLKISIFKKIFLKFTCGATFLLKINIFFKILKF